MKTKECISSVAFRLTTGQHLEGLLVKEEP